MARVILARAHDVEHQGARTSFGLSEWTISRNIIESAADILRCQGIDLYIFGGTLSGRIKRAIELHESGRVDLIIEPHCNWVGDERTRGSFIIAYHNSLTALHLAYMMATGLDRDIGRWPTGVCRVDARRRWIGSKREYDGAKRIALIQDIPFTSLMIECCHLSNESDAEFIARSANRCMVGASIGQSIVDWLNNRAMIKRIMSRSQDPGGGA